MRATPPPPSPRYWPHVGYYGLVAKWRGLRREHLRKSVVVSGSPRSGTTWVGNIVTEMTGWPSMEEQTGTTRNPGLRELHGWGGRPYRNPDSPDPALAADLEQVLTGRYLSPGLIFTNRHNTLGLWAQRPLASKVIDMNLIMPWVATNLPWLRVVQLIRNPLTVVASRLVVTTAVWSSATSLGSVYADFMAVEPSYAGPLEFETPAETQTAAWAIEHAWLRDNMDRLGGLHWLRYEDLRDDPHRTIPDLARFVGVEGIEVDQLRSFKRVSRSTTKAPVGSATPASPTSSSPQGITDDVLERMHGILEHYGYPFYDRETLLADR